MAKEVAVRDLEVNDYNNIMEVLMAHDCFNYDSIIEIHVRSLEEY